MRTMGNQKIAQTHKQTYKALILMQIIAGAAMTVGCDQGQEPAERALPGSPESFYIEVVDGSVTLQARDMYLEEVLIEIARQSDIELLLQGTLRGRVSIDFREIPLPSAIGRILQDQSFALQYVSTAGNQTRADYPPNRLWVFATDAQQPEQRKSTGSDVVVTSLPSPVDEQAAGLTFALAHESADVRLEAISELTNLGDTQAPPVLENAALHDWDPAVRVEALDALGDSGDYRVLPILEQGLYDTSKQVRDAAIAAIADIGGDGSVSALATALNSDDADLREEAVDALGDIGGETVIALLQQALADENRSVREAAAEYLSEL
jgi:hypothetical protein